MTTILSREELHALVWKTRLRDLVEPFNLSEPTIRKRCRDKDIPLPSAGHWTKLARGETGHIPPLPPRGAGMDELVSFAANPEHPVRRHLTEEEILGPIPDPPIFPQPLAEVRAFYLARVGSPNVDRDLTQAHHKIRTLLAEDHQRAEYARQRGYTYSFDEILFDNPFEQRRLRVLNAIMMATAKAGGVVRIWTKAARSAVVHM